MGNIPAKIRRREARSHKLRKVAAVLRKVAAVPRTRGRETEEALKKGANRSQSDFRNQRTRKDTSHHNKSKYLWTTRPGPRS